MKEDANEGIWEWPAARKPFSPLALNIIEQFKLKDGLRLKEMGELAGGFEYPTVYAAMARFDEALETLIGSFSRKSRR